MQSKRPVRGRRTPDEVVRYHLERQRASGLPISTYCRREGFSAWTFHQWRERLSAAGSVPAPTPLSAQPLSFIELPQPQATSDYELYIGDEVSLRFSSGRQVSEVASLVRALRESLSGR